MKLFFPYWKKKLVTMLILFAKATLVQVPPFNGFTLKSSWGPLPLGGFVGTSRVISEKPLIVEFENEAYVLGPLRIGVPAKTRNYRFVYADADIAVAISSSGGSTLLKKR